MPQPIVIVGFCTPCREGARPLVAPILSRRLPVCRRRVGGAGGEFSLQRSRIAARQVRDAGGAASGYIDGQVGEPEHLADDSLADHHGLNFCSGHAREVFADDAMWVASSPEEIEVRVNVANLLLEIMDITFNEFERTASISGLYSTN